MCDHRNIRLATLSDMQDICLDCGAVTNDYCDQQDDSDQEVCIDCEGSNILEGICVDCQAEFLN